MASTNRRKKSKVEVQAYKRSVKSGASLLGSAVGIIILLEVQKFMKK